MQNLPQQNKSEISLRTQFKVSSTLTPNESAVVELYGTDFWKQVAPQFPSMNREATYPTLQSAVEDDAAPSLVTLDRIYLAENPLYNPPSVMWLRIQILEMLMFTGLREKMTEQQQYALARQLRKLGYHCKLSEMMQFFTRFEQGYYKTFQGYERPNPQVITESFNNFLYDLEEARGNYQKIKDAELKAQEIKEMNENAVPCPEHNKKKLERLYNNTNANVQLSKQKPSTEITPSRSND